MALFKCPKCNEMFIESKQMYVCPSCYYKGKLIELKITEMDEEGPKQRFNARETIKKALDFIEYERPDIHGEPISFNTERLERARRKLLYIFRQNNIILWRDLLMYSKHHDIRDMYQLGTYLYASLAHLLCITLGIEEVTK